MLQKIKNLLKQPTDELGKWSRFAVLQVRIWFHCLRLLKINRCGTQAAALAYHSIFGMVPLAIVTLMVFQMFPAFQEVSGKIKAIAFDQMNLTKIEYPVKDGESAENAGKEHTITAAQKIEELSESFISKAHGGAITIIGLVLVIWAAIALLTTIEKTFNTIFHVGTGRGFLHRLFNYWALLTLGPILLALGIYVSGHFMKNNETYQRMVSQNQQQQAGMQTAPGASIAAERPVEPNAIASASGEAAEASSFRETLGRLVTISVQFFISLIAIFFLYFFLPNTRVSPGSALWGAFVAGLIWMLAKYGFSSYVTKFVPQFAVYGVLGIIPLTVMWIYLSWLIVLFGLQLTYATQNIKRLDAAEFSKARKQEKCFLANNQTVIRVMEYVLNAFERKDQKPVSVEATAYRLDMPTDFTEKILERLVKSGLLCHTSEPSVGYVPATDGSHITLDEVSRAISEVSFAQPSAADANNMQQVFDELQRHLSQYTLKQVLNKDETFETGEKSPEEEQDDSDAYA